MNSENLNNIILTERESDLAPPWTALIAGDFYTRDRFGHEDDLGRAAERAIDNTLLGLISRADIAIVNLEGPVRISRAPIPKSGPSLQMDNSAPAVLERIGFNVVSLANNHIMDYGPQGLHRTIESCHEKELLVCGAGKDANEAMKPVVTTVAGGIRLAILSFCEQEFGIADLGLPGTSWISHPLALQQVNGAAETADVVIVIAHGGVEEVPFSPIQRQVQLRRFIDAGATLVVGHHPHVPQGWERYEKGMIFYSLGNLLFDYPGGARYPKTEWGLVIQVHFCGTVMQAIELVPVERFADGKVGKLNQNRKLQHCLHYLYRLSALQAEPETLIPYWQETAVHLWRTRYRPWLQRACAMSPLVADGSIPFHLAGLYRAVKRRLGKRFQCGETNTPSDIGNGLLLLNTIRNESHRWTLETALNLLYGDEVDHRTPEVRAEMSELLEWTEG
jgi:poly-gamma-glutamate synthesis protein (capsule biosynthesis protein)